MEMVAGNNNEKIEPTTHRGSAHQEEIKEATDTGKLYYDSAANKYFINKRPTP